MLLPNDRTQLAIGTLVMKLVYDTEDKVLMMSIERQAEES